MDIIRVFFYKIRALFLIFKKRAGEVFPSPPAFISEPCVALAYLEPCHIQNLRNIRNPVKHLWCSSFLITLCNPGIFGILVYSEPEEYSEPCQASMMLRFFNEPWHIYDEVFHSEPFVTIAYLDS